MLLYLSMWWQRIKDLTHVTSSKRHRLPLGPREAQRCEEEVPEKPLLTAVSSVQIKIQKMSSPKSIVQSSDLVASSSTPSVLQSVEPRCKVLVSSLHPPSLFTPAPVSQSVECPRIKDDRLIYSLSSMSCSRQVRQFANATNCFVCWTSYAAAGHWYQEFAKPQDTRSPSRRWSSERWSSAGWIK